MSSGLKGPGHQVLEVTAETLPSGLQAVVGIKDRWAQPGTSWSSTDGPCVPWSWLSTGQQGGLLLAQGSGGGRDLELAQGLVQLGRWSPEPVSPPSWLCSFLPGGTSGHLAWWLFCVKFSRLKRPCPVG